jgi:hypothetical protein
MVEDIIFYLISLSLLALRRLGLLDIHCFFGQALENNLF